MTHNRIHISTLALAAVLMFTVLPFTGCHNGAGKSSSIEAVDMINAAFESKDNERLLSLADSLGMAGKISKGESNYWQGYANYFMGQRDLAEYYWQEGIRVTEHSTAPNDLVYYAKSASYLTSMLCRYAEYAAALHTALPIINRLEKIQCDTTSDYSNLLIFAGCCQIYFDKKDTKAVERLERAYQMHIDNIRQHASKAAYRDAVAGVINIAYIWVNVKGYEEGLAWADRLGQLVQEYQKLYADDKSYIDKQWARYLIFHATSLEGVGRHDEAERAYKEYLQTQFSDTREGWTNASEYLTAAKRWDEAVASYRTIMEYLQKELNVYSLDNIQRYLLKKYRAHQMLDQQDSINNTARQICELLDSAIINNRRLDASELHSIHVRDMEIVEAEARSARQRQVYTIVVVVLLIIAFAVYAVFRHRADLKLRKAHDALKAAYDQLEETTTAKERMESELRIARNIQMSMVPGVFPEYEGLDMFASMTPAKEVGGDLYCYVMQGDLLYFCLGDVSGKGVPASLFMAQSARLFRTLATEGMMPADIAYRMNNELAENNDRGMFVTMFIGLLHLNTGRLDFCNCGHNPPVIDGQFLELQYDNQPLGLWEDDPFEGESIDDIRGRQMLIYTDGLNEAENPQQQLLGNDRLIELMSTAQSLDSRQVIDMLKQAVEEHRAGAEPNDDLTMMYLCLKRA